MPFFKTRSILTSILLELRKLNAPIRHQADVGTQDGSWSVRPSHELGCRPPPPLKAVDKPKNTVTIDKAELAEFIEIARKAAVFDALCQAVDREMPPLPADVGGGDVTSILTLLETRALCPDQQVAQRAREDIQAMHARVAAQDRINSALAKISEQYGIAARLYMFTKNKYGLR